MDKSGRESDESHGDICLLKLGILDRHSRVSQWLWGIATIQLVTASGWRDTHDIRVDVSHSVGQVQIESGLLTTG